MLNRVAGKTTHCILQSKVCDVMRWGIHFPRLCYVDTQSEESPHEINNTRGAAGALQAEVGGSTASVGSP